jgi:2-aminoadipate transaminase
MVAALNQEFGQEVSWPAPRGGFFLWATLPALIDSDAMINRAVEKGVIYVAGEAFFVSPDRESRSTANQQADNDPGRNIIRLSFSAPSATRIQEGVSRLAQTVREELAAIEAPAS